MQEHAARPHPTKRARWLRSLMLLLVVPLLVPLALAGPAGAADDGLCVKPPPRKDDTIHIQGCLRDDREKPPKPVPDVSITVEDSSGNVVGEGVSNETGFFDIPQVVNGCSDLMVEAFGDAGRHARSAVGVYRLPMNFAVEVDAVVQLS